MVRDLDRAHRVVLAAELGGEDGGEQVLRAQALEIGCDLASPLPADQSEGARGVPAPAGAEHGRLQRRVHEKLPNSARVHHTEDALEGEAVLRPQREEDAVVGGGGLELEVEALADALAQGHAPCTIDAPAERGVNDELLAARLVEE